MIKSCEDAIVKVIGVDDSRVTTLTATKKRQSEKREGIGITIEIQYS
jgi:Holliday junction resolvase RusA-like endonuclease